MVSLRRVAKELRLPPGYTLHRESNGGHLVLRRPDGSEVRDDEGRPLTISTTPSDWRTRKNELSRLRRVLHHRPKENT